MANVNVQNKNFQKRWDFGGSTLPTDWSLVQLGAGQTVSFANSVMTIAAGTTANAATILRCQRAFTLKAFIRYIASLSQRIANQTVYLELVNEAGTTSASIKLDGTTATTGKYGSANAGTANGDVSFTIPTTASYVTFEIMAEIEQIIFNAVVSNSSSAKTYTGMLDRLILEPDEQYYIQIRVVNGSTAPASNTNVNIDAVYAEDLTMLGVEILRASGDMNQATAIACRSVGGTVDNVGTVNTVTIAYIAPKMSAYTDTTTALAAAATFTGTARDVGSTFLYSKFRGVCYADQAGTLYVEQSADNVTWTITNTIAVAAATVVKFEDPVVMRYQRVRYVNGATAQTAFRLYSLQVAN